MQFIVFDLEATCWSGNRMGRRHEIIEIAAYRVNNYGEISQPFQTFVRPVINPSLSIYCQNLTKISQADVDHAPDFRSAATKFVEWLQATDEPYVMCSWGGKDLELLEDDCEYHGLGMDWLQPYLDLKEQYHQIRNLDKRAGLKRTLAREGLDFEGQHHRALDDAANLVRLFTRYLDMWMY